MVAVLGILGWRLTAVTLCPSMQSDTEFSTKAQGSLGGWMAAGQRGNKAVRGGTSSPGEGHCHSAIWAGGNINRSFL